MHIPQARQASRSPGWLATAALAALSLSTPAVSGTAPDGDPGASFEVLHGFDGSDGAGPASARRRCVPRRHRLPDAPQGDVTLLHSFACQALEGAFPITTLLEASDGYFYGTTGSARGSSQGAIFKVSPNGAFEVLHCAR